MTVLWKSARIMAAVAACTGLGPMAMAQVSEAKPPIKTPAPINTETSSKGVRVIMPEVAPTPPPPAVTTTAPTRPVVNVVPEAKADRPVPATAPAPNRVNTAPVPVAPTITVAPVIKACARPFAQTDLTLDNAAKFDKALRSKLRSGRKTVTLNLTQPYSVNASAPQPLGPWLDQIKATGGIVAVKTYCEGGRGFSDFLAKLFGGGPKNPYKAAGRYDAMLHVDAVDQIVTQIEFTPRVGG